MKRSNIALVIAIIGIAIVTIWLVRRSLPAKTGTQTRVEAPSLPATLTVPLSPVTAGKKDVDFGGVSFSYESSLFSDVSEENVEASPLENADDKPDYVSPRHVQFKILDDYGSPRESFDFDPGISVYPLADFPQVYEISKDSVDQVNGKIKELRTLLSQRSTSVAGEIPYLLFADATQTFRAHVKRVDFKGGKGILFLTQYDVEPSVVNNQGLTCIFEGITDDGLYYVLATFPVTAPGLAESYETPTHEGYTPSVSLYTPAGKKAQKEYLAKVVRMIEALPPGKFSPDLTLLEQLVRTIHVHGTV